MASTLQLLAAYLRGIAARASQAGAQAKSLGERAARDQSALHQLTGDHPSAAPPLSALGRAAHCLSERAAPSLLAVARQSHEFADHLAPGSDLSTPGAPAEAPRLAVVGPPHGGHGGGERAPGSREPVEDISRERIDELLEDGVSSPDELPAGVVWLRYAWIDAGGHTCVRHDLSQAGERAQRDRCERGLDPANGSTTDWSHGHEHTHVRVASAFRGHQSIVFAEARVWSDSKTLEERNLAENAERNRFFVRLPAREILGANFTEHVAGWRRIGSKKRPEGSEAVVFSDSLKIEAHYHRTHVNAPWVLHTMFPVERGELP